MEIILSICIATTSARSEIIKPLLATLQQQMVPEVEIIINEHETDNIGKKRNTMLNICRGKWQVAIDSDDMIAPDYIEKILAALEHNPDCVGIFGTITTDGRNEKKWAISKDYHKWYEDWTGPTTYFRTPNHISPIRTSLALQAGFPEIDFAEDFGFSKRVLPLLKTEVIVPGNLYHYKFITNK